DGIKSAAAWVRSIFPDLRVTLEDVVAEGDRVVTRFTARGTQQGTFLGVPPTGKAVTVSAVHVDRVSDGLIAERWEVVDLLTALRQIGATIAPPST
ncbi:MAG TPA: ester cyclase, partial [Chloroflexota bacterium]